MRQLLQPAKPDYAMSRADGMGTPAYDYHFESEEAPHTAAYITPYVLNCCRKIGAKLILDVGSGNGALCGSLEAAGFDVVGCEPSEEGLTLARRQYPHIEFHKLGAYDDLPSSMERCFDAVVCTEVIEHLFLPRLLPRFAGRALRTNGHLILSTPYHGYLKNLAISLSDGWDRHLDPLWDGGHVKFWSANTLSRLLVEEGFEIVEFIGTGRFAYFWKSMIFVSRKS